MLTTERAQSLRLTVSRDYDCHLADRILIKELAYEFLDGAVVSAACSAGSPCTNSLWRIEVLGPTS